MSIDHIIVHRLEKQRESPSTLHPRKTELPVTPAAEHLLNGIRATYEKRTGKAYGTFQADREAYPFSRYLESYLDEGAAGDFAAFTRRSMRRLQHEIDKADWATGGYVVFILYRAAGAESATPHLFVVMLNDRRGTAIDPATLEIRDVTHLVIDELHLAVRIDVGAWRAGEPRYLSFVKGRKTGTTVSRYFRDFVGCAEYVDSVPESRKLVRAVRSFGKNENLSVEAAREVRKKVYDHAVEAHEREEPLDLGEISRQIDPDQPTKFLEYANSESVGLSDGFDPDLGVLRRLRRFSGSDDELSVSFDARVLGSRVLYDKGDKSLKIVRLPKSLERQLDGAA